MKLMKVFMKFLFLFIMIFLSLIISRRVLIYSIISSSEPGLLRPANPDPLSTVSPFVVYAIEAFFVMVFLWIANKIMQGFSFLKSKMIHNSSQ